MKTATIERWHCYGTPNHHLYVTYKGRPLQWRDPNFPGLSFAFAVMVDYGAESIEACKAHARRMGFTHVRFAGEWNLNNMPRGGKL